MSPGDRECSGNPPVPRLGSEVDSKGLEVLEDKLDAKDAAAALVKRSEDASSPDRTRERAQGGDRKGSSRP